MAQLTVRGKKFPEKPLEFWALRISSSAFAVRFPQSFTIAHGAGEAPFSRIGLDSSGGPMKIQTIPSIVFFSTLFSAAALAQEPLNAARYDAEGHLAFPDDAATWVHAGSVLGGNYSDMPFDPAHPGTLGVVQIEPSAYAYYMEHGEYADGTMFLLSFYGAEANSRPQLSGFVQGDLRLREIHVIDKARFAEGRGFFQYENADQISTKIADGSECVSCHMNEGSLDGTFVQFYPTLRARQ
jgi:hypothetical protein